MPHLFDPDGVSTAWTEAGAHAALATGEQARMFLVALANRLHQEREDSEQWGLGW
jgi:hypothetical protein